VPDSKYAPKHRGAPPKRVRTGATNVAKLSSIAVWATGLTVVGGVVAQGAPDPVGGLVSLQSAAGLSQPTAADLSPADLAERQQQAVSRSADRGTALARAKKDSLTVANGVAVTRSEDLTTADPRTLAQALMPEYGLSASEFECLDSLWNSESDWDVHADNPSSSAYGIPQALPGSKMSSAGPDWADNPETQIRWGLGYIRNSYGTACSAWSFKQGHGWY
jgi:hypothetical protein